MAPAAERRTGLGKGLGALIPKPAQPAPRPSRSRSRTSAQSLPAAAARRAAGSRAARGQHRRPRCPPAGARDEVLDGYQLVAGERRVRAAQIAGLDRVPAIVRQMAAKDQLAIAIVENIQRADLNAMEEAHAYRQLADEFKLTQDEIATSVGRARSTVANTLRLLDLEPAVQQALERRQHHRGPRPRPGRARPRRSNGNSSRPSMARGLSVRRTEELVRRLRDEPRQQRPTTADLDGEMEGLEEDLRRALGTKVSWPDPARGVASSSSTTATRSSPASSTV